MHLFLLGGNSPENWEWINSVSEELDSLFSDSTLQYYDHWEHNRDIGAPDIPIEAEKLNRLVGNLKEGEDYAIFAKSIGTIIAMTAIRQYELRPRACFFFGLPAKSAEESGLALGKLMTDWHVPTLFGQNSNDPEGSMKDVRSLIINCRVLNFETAEYPKNTHKYNSLDSIKEDVGRFLGRIN